MRLSRRDFHAVVVGGAIAGGVRLSGSQVGSEWRLLFDGTSLNAWRGYKSDAVPPGWRVVDGTLSKDARSPTSSRASSSATSSSRSTGRSATAGNSGIFYRGTEEDEPHLLDGAGVSAARRRQRRGQQDPAHLRRRRLRALSVAGRAPQGRSASGTAPASSPAGRTWSIGSTASSCSSTSCGARLGSEGGGQQVRQVAALRPGHRAGTSRCRATTPARWRSATSASGRLS